jgi:hypothetical protein
MWFLLILALLMNMLVGRYVSKPRGEPFGGKIRDVGFDTLPDLSNYEIIHDLTVVIPLAFLILNWKSVNKEGYIQFLTFMYFMRALSNMVTQFPYIKNRTCDPKHPFSYCNDYMFSGHTTFNIVTSYFVNKGLFPVYPILSSMVTIATRAHYSIDVLMAWIIFFALKCNITV